MRIYQLIFNITYYSFLYLYIAFHIPHNHLKSTSGKGEKVMKTQIWKTEEGKSTVHRLYSSYLNKWEGGVDRHYVETPLGKTAVLECGEKNGYPTILLHGSMSTSLTWMNDGPLWGKSRRILAIDLPGEPGYSEARRPTLSSAEPEQWLNAVMDGLGLEKASLVGMSLGGWFAFRFATRYPERVAAIAGIVPGGLAPQRKDFLPKVIWYSLQGKKGAEKINRLVNHKIEMPEEAMLFHNLIRKDFRPLTEVLPVFTDKELKNLPMPVYYAGGDCDAILDTKASSDRLRELKPDAVINVLKDTGHVILDRGPEIDAFLP